MCFTGSYTLVCMYSALVVGPALHVELEPPGSGRHLTARTTITSSLSKSHRTRYRLCFFLPVGLAGHIIVKTLKF
jgi:hypothetical protein